MSLLSSIFGSSEEKREVETSNTLFEEPKDFQIVEKEAPARKTRRGSHKKDVTPESEREAKEKEECTIFVGNLPLDISRPALSKFFGDCGSVQSTRIRSAPVSAVKVSNKSDPSLMRRAAIQTGQLNTSAAKASVHAYVVFDSTESVEKALLKNNGVFQNRRIRVDRSQPTWMQHTKRAVFVGNLPFDDAEGESDLQLHFAKYCGCSPTMIEAVRLVRDKTTYHCKGFGYVLLADADVYATALSNVHGTKYKKRELRVMPCSKKSKPKHVNRETKINSTKESTKRKAPAKSEAVGALKRIIEKGPKEPSKKRRLRGNPKGSVTKQKKKSNVDKELRKIIQGKVDKVKNERMRKGKGRR